MSLKSIFPRLNFHDKKFYSFVQKAFDQINILPSGKNIFFSHCLQKLLDFLQDPLKTVLEITIPSTRNNCTQDLLMSFLVYFSNLKVLTQAKDSSEKNIIVRGFTKATSLKKNVFCFYKVVVTGENYDQFETWDFVQKNIYYYGAFRRIIFFSSFYNPVFLKIGSVADTINIEDEKKYFYVVDQSAADPTVTSLSDTAPNFTFKNVGQNSFDSTLLNELDNKEKNIVSFFVEKDKRAGFFGYMYLNINKYFYKKLLQNRLRSNSFGMIDFFFETNIYLLAKKNYIFFKKREKFERNLYVNSGAGFPSCQTSFLPISISKFSLKVVNSISYASYSFLASSTQNPQPGSTNLFAESTQKIPSRNSFLYLLVATIVHVFGAVSLPEKSAKTLEHLRFFFQVDVFGRPVLYVTYIFKKEKEGLENIQTSYIWSYSYVDLKMKAIRLKQKVFKKNTTNSLFNAEIYNENLHHGYGIQIIWHPSNNNAFDIIIPERSLQNTEVSEESERSKQNQLYAWFLGRLLLASIFEEENNLSSNYSNLQADRHSLKKKLLELNKKKPRQPISNLNFPTELKKGKGFLEDKKNDLIENLRALPSKKRPVLLGQEGLAQNILGKAKDNLKKVQKLRFKKIGDRNSAYKLFRASWLELLNPFKKRMYVCARNGNYVVSEHLETDKTPFLFQDCHHFLAIEDLSPAQENKLQSTKKKLGVFFDLPLQGINLAEKSVLVQPALYIYKENTLVSKHVMDRIDKDLIILRDGPALGKLKTIITQDEETKKGEKTKTIYYPPSMLQIVSSKDVKTDFLEWHMVLEQDSWSRHVSETRGKIQKQTRYVRNSDIVVEWEQVNPKKSKTKRVVGYTASVKDFKDNSGKEESKITYQIKHRTLQGEEDAQNGYSFLPLGKATGTLACLLKIHFWTKMSSLEILFNKKVHVFETKTEGTVFSITTSSDEKKSSFFSANYVTSSETGEKLLFKEIGHAQQNIYRILSDESNDTSLRDYFDYSLTLVSEDEKKVKVILSQTKESFANKFFSHPELKTGFISSSLVDLYLQFCIFFSQKKQEEYEKMKSSVVDLQVQTPERFLTHMYTNAQVGGKSQLQKTDLQYCASRIRRLSHKYILRMLCMLYVFRSEENYETPSIRNIEEVDVYKQGDQLRYNIWRFLQILDERLVKKKHYLGKLEGIFSDFLDDIFLFLYIPWKRKNQKQSFESLAKKHKIEGKILTYIPEIREFIPYLQWHAISSLIDYFFSQIHGGQQILKNSSKLTIKGFANVKVGLSQIPPKFCLFRVLLLNSYRRRISTYLSPLVMRIFTYLNPLVKKVKQITPNKKGLQTPTKSAGTLLGTQNIFNSSSTHNLPSKFMKSLPADQTSIYNFSSSTLIALSVFLMKELIAGNSLQGKILSLISNPQNIKKLLSEEEGAKSNILRDSRTQEYADNRQVYSFFRKMFKNLNKKKKKQKNSTEIAVNYQELQKFVKQKFFEPKNKSKDNYILEFGHLLGVVLNQSNYEDILYKEDDSEIRKSNSLYSTLLRDIENKFKDNYFFKRKIKKKARTEEGPAMDKKEEDFKRIVQYFINQLKTKADGIQLRKTTVQITEFFVLIGVFWYWFSHNKGVTLTNLLNLQTVDLKSLMQLNSLFSMAMFVVNNKNLIPLVLNVLKDLFDGVKDRDSQKIVLTLISLLTRYLPQIVSAIAFNMMRLNSASGVAQFSLQGILSFMSPLLLFIVSRLMTMSKEGEDVFSSKDYILRAALDSIEPFLNSAFNSNLESLKALSGLSKLPIPPFLKDMIFGKMSVILWSFLYKQATVQFFHAQNILVERVEEKGIDLFLENCMQWFFDNAVADVMQNTYGLKLQPNANRQKFDLLYMFVSKVFSKLLGLKENKILKYSAKSSGRMSKSSGEKGKDYIILNQSGLQFYANDKSYKTVHAISKAIFKSENGSNLSSDEVKKIYKFLQPGSVDLLNDEFKKIESTLISSILDLQGDREYSSKLLSNWSPLKKAVAIVFIEKNRNNESTLSKKKKWQNIEDNMKGTYFFQSNKTRTNNVYSNFLNTLFRNKTATLEKNKMTPGFKQFLEKNNNEVKFDKFREIYIVTHNENR